MTPSLVAGRSARVAGPTLGLALALAVIAGCGDGPRPCIAPQSTPTADIPGLLAELDGLGFPDFLERSYAHLLRRSPETVTELGLSAELGLADDRLDDLSESYLDATCDLVDGILDRLHGYERDALSPDQQLSYDIYDWYLEDRSADRTLRYFEYPVQPVVNAAHNTTLLLLEDLHPITDAASGWAYVERLRQVSVKIAQLLDALRIREARGLIAPGLVLEWSLGQISRVAGASPRDLPLYQSFATRLDAAAISSGQRAELLDAAEDAIACHVIPAYATLRDEVTRLIAHAPTQAGVGQFPGGDAYYAAALHHHTTTDLDADAIHQLGLDQIESIHAEMRIHFDALGYPADESLPQLFGRVAEDGGWVAAADVVDAYTELIADAEARLAPAFHSPPPIPVVVIGGATGGFYVAGTPDGSRPGAFYAGNTVPEARFGMATLAYHEAIPGHHLQLSLAQALDLPTARRTITFTAYVEGWAHYAEHLAGDLGWYQGDRYGDLGRLQGEAFRAARLVVDTGLHARGWSFDDAVAYLVDNVGFSYPQAANQIGRYMAWPGQATAYRVGMLHLLDLRAQAQAALGEQFDLADFHAAVLDAGAMPLTLVDGEIARYIAGDR